MGLKVLKNKLSEYVRIAERGEVVLVCDRDRVVAVLGPPELQRSTGVADALLADAVRHGYVTPALLPPSPPPPSTPVISGKELAVELASDRADR